MYQLIEIYKYNLRLLLKNKWIYIILLLDLLYLNALSLDSILRVEQNSHTLVIHYVHENFLFLFVVLLISIWVFFQNNNPQYANLIDTYSFSNWKLYLGIYFSLLSFFFLYDIFKFLLFFSAKTIISSNFSYLKSLIYYLVFSFPNIMFYIALAALLASIFKNIAYSFLLGFLFKLYDLALFNINTLYADIINTSGFTYLSFSDFGIMGVFNELFKLNRLFILMGAIFLVFSGLLVFKCKRREKIKKSFLIISIISLIFATYFFYKFNTVENLAFKNLNYDYSDLAFFEINNNNTIQFNDYKIEGKIFKNEITIKVNFIAENTDVKTIPLNFYLDSQFSVKEIKVNERQPAFNRKGNLILVDERIPPKSSVNCTIFYKGSPENYGKDEKNDLHYRLTTYLNEKIIFFPAWFIWYPQPTKNKVNFNDNNFSFLVDIKADFPLIANKNMIYGYSGLNKKELDGINYFYHSLHEDSIKVFHNKYKNKILFINNLIPLENKFTVYEIPRNIYCPDKIPGEIFISEDIIIKNSINSLMDGEKNSLEKKIIEAWIPVKEGEMYNYFVYEFIEYLYQERYNPEFKAEEFIDRVYKNWQGPELWKDLIKYYQRYGISAAKKLLNQLHKISMERYLNEGDILQNIEIREGF